MNRKKQLRSLICISLALILACTPFFNADAIEGSQQSDPADIVQEQPAEADQQATDEKEDAAVEDAAVEPEEDSIKEESADGESKKEESGEEPSGESRTEYHCSVDGVEITAVLSDADIIPDGAKLSAARITDQTSGYNYDAYMEALNAGQETVCSENNTLLYDIAFIKDGKEIQPDGGTVTVTFDFKDDQLAEDLGVKKASDLNVIHLPLKDKIRDKYDTTKAAKSIKVKDIEKETVKDKELKVNVKNETVEFKTKDFSAFAFNNSVRLGATPTSSYRVTLNTYDFENNLVIPDVDTDYKYFIRALIKDNTTGNYIAGDVKEIDMTEAAAYVDLSFTTDPYYNPEPYQYDSDDTNTTLSLRLIHQINPYDKPVPNHWKDRGIDNLSSSDTTFSDKAPDGYEITGSDVVMRPDSATINMHETKPKEYYVRIQVDEGELNVKESDGLYALVEIDHTNSNDNTYSPVNVATATKTVDPDTGKTYYDIPVTHWYHDQAGTDPKNEHFTGNEKKVRVILVVKDANGTWHVETSEDGQTVPYINVGDIVNQYEVISYPVTENGVVSVENRIIDDTAADATKYYDIIKLAKPSDSGFEYTLEYILSGFNVVTLSDPEDPNETMHHDGAYGYGDLLNNTHMMGGALIRGQLSGSTPQIGDSALLTKPSYVGSFAEGQISVNGRNDNENPPDFYIGDGNTVFGETINGTHIEQGYNKGGKTIVNGAYIDWNRLRDIVISSSNAMAARSTTINVEDCYDNNAGKYIVRIQGGQNVTITNPQNRTYAVELENLGDPADENTKATIISFLEENVDMPMVTSINGKQPGNYLIDLTDTQGAGAQKEDGVGMAIVWNCPNAKQVTIKNASPEVGHVIAPLANLDIICGDYNGCMVGDSAYSAAEGHQWGYRGGTIISTNVGFTAVKKVDGEDPTADQTFSFNLSELENGSWRNIESVPNKGNAIEFQKLPYSSDHPVDEPEIHYYRINEDASSADDNFTTDGTWYVVKVSVTYTLDEEDDVVAEASNTYYKVEASDTETLVKEDGTIDETKLQTIEAGMAEFVFNNAEKQDEVGSLKIKKTFDGVPEGTDTSGLEFKITDPEGNEETVTYEQFDENGEYEIGTDLPIGAEYSVEETNADTLITNYSLTADSVTSGSEAATKDGAVIELTNKYTEDKGSLTVKKNVTVNGEAVKASDYELVDGDYKFNLYKVEGDKETKVKTVTLTIKNGKSEETVVDGLDAGTYIVEEVTPSNRNIRIMGDSSRQEVTVTSGEIGTVPTAEFTNNYAKTSIELEGSKTLQNGDISAYSFDFSLYDKAEYEHYQTSLLAKLNPPKPVSTASVPAGSTATDGKVKFKFDPIEYTLGDLMTNNAPVKEKTFKYVAVENVPEEAIKVTVDGKECYYDKNNDILYDPSVIEVTVKVTYDPKTGKMSAVTQPETISLDFVNKKMYTKLSLTKSIDAFIGEDTDGEYVNATLVFRLTYNDPLTGEKGKTREVSVQFDKNNATSQTIEVNKIPIDTTVEVKEIYSSNYKPGATVNATKKTDKNGYPIWTVSIDNQQSGTTTGSGIINNVDKNEAGKYEWNVGGESQNKPN